jgi:hypothetical protein
MTVNLSLLGGAGWQFSDNNGVPLSGGLLYTYAAGTTTTQTTYISNTGLTANPNPVVLDSAGRIVGEIWLTQGQAYKFVLKNAAGVTIGTYDNVPGANDPTDIYASIYATLAAPSGSSLIGYQPAGTGAVATTVQAKLRETVSILDFGAVSDPTGVIDSTAAIQAAIAYAWTKYKRALPSTPSIGGSFPITKLAVMFPEGVYNISSTINVVSNYSVCDLIGIGEACINWTGTGGTAISVFPTSGLPITTTPVHIKNLMIRSNNTGNIGLLVQQISNCLFENLNFYGFNYAIQNICSESCIYDFKGGAIQSCDYGFLIQQFTTNGAIVKPNLTWIKSVYFIENFQNSIVIRRNPAESAINNGSGGVLHIEDCNFQGGCAGPAVQVSYPGEIPGYGVVNIIRSWFEGYGNTALSLQVGTVTMDNCFIVNGTSPIILQDGSCVLVMTETNSYFSTTPTNNCVVSRADIALSVSQVTTRNCRITSDGISTVNLGQNNVLPMTSYIANSVISGVISSYSGTTGTLAATTGFEDIINTNTIAATKMILSVTQSGGGVSYYANAMVVSSGTAIVVNTIGSANVTVSGSGASIRLTNTSASTIVLNWSLIVLG